MNGDNDNANYTGETLNNRFDVLNGAFGANGGASYSSPLGNILRGVKILGPGVQLAPIADDVIGLVFVNRPLLNLSDDNVRKSPRFSLFYQAGSGSLAGYVRGLLDYRTAMLYPHPALDNKSAWISPLTNLVKKSDGFPDLDLEIETSQPGIRGEVHQWPSSILEENGKFTINQTYHNPKPGFMPFLFETWESYIPEVRLGDHEMEPYPEAVFGNWWDFDCRIYHFIMHKNIRNIENMFMTIQSIPSTYPMGALATIDNDSPSRRGQGQDELTVSFSSVGARFNTFKVADSFNGATVFFNPAMADGKREATYRKLKPSEFLNFNYQAYPWINIETMEMEWWVLK